MMPTAGCISGCSTTGNARAGVIYDLSLFISSFSIYVKPMAGGKMRTQGRYIKMNKAVVVIVSALLAFTNCHTAAFAGDLPAGAVVQAGNAAITSDGTNMTVATDAAKTWIDWSGGFNIGAANSVNNIAQEASAVILHHDITGQLSNIQGSLTANCNVFLLNPSGTLFGSGASVNVAGLVVSTLNMSMQDFLNGSYCWNRHRRRRFDHQRRDHHRRRAYGCYFGRRSGEE